MRTHGTRGSRTTVACARVLVVAIAALALAACGGTSTTTTQSERASPSAAPTSSAAVMSTYTALGAKLTDPGTLARFMRLYADDATLTDRAFGGVYHGAAAISGYFLQFLGPGGVYTYRPVCWRAGTEGAIAEEIVASSEMRLPSLEVLRLRGGKVVQTDVYYLDAYFGRPPVPLATAPGPSDTEAASLRTAGAYWAALRRLDPAALGRLYTDATVYRDVASARQYKGATATAAAHARVFAMHGVAYSGGEVVAGPGWAAVLWARTDREGGKPHTQVSIPAEWTKRAGRPTIDGATVLEIRGGKIVRETVYCDHLRTKL